MSDIINTILLFLLRPIWLLCCACRNVAWHILLITQDEWFLCKYRGKFFHYKIVRRKRKPFHISDNTLWWTGKQATVALDIPDEIGREEARILCLAQTIDPRFADELFRMMHSMGQFIKEELESEVAND